MTVDRFSPWGMAASGTEHGEQTAFMAWCNRVMWLGVPYGATPEMWSHPTALALMREHVAANMPVIPALRWIHAVPNGGERGAASAGNMKAEGVKSGVADIFWPVAHCYGEVWQPKFYHGLYIEMKRKDGKASDVAPKQREFRAHVLDEGYAWCWANGWLTAREKLIAYATGKWNIEMEQL